MKNESADISLEIQANLDGDIKEDLDEINEGLEEISKSSGTSFEKASNATDTFNKKTDASLKTLHKLDNSIVSLGRTFNRVKPNILSLPTKLSENAENAVIKIRNMESSISGLTKIASISFAGIAGSAAIAIKKYSDFEDGILKVQTISNRSFEEIKKAADDLSVKYGLSVSQIVEGNYQLVSSMGDVANAQEILDTSAKLSIAGFTDYESAMNGLVAVLNGYKMEATEANRVADILMTIQNKGVTTINELQASLSKVTSLASNVNVSFEDLASALTTITANKVETAQAITGLKSAFGELGRSGSEAAKNFKLATGEMFSEFMKTHTIVDAIQKLEDYSKKTGKSFMDMFGSLEAGNAIMNLAGGNLNKLKNSLDDINNSSGTANKALSKLDEGANRAFQKLKEQVNKSVRDIGEALIPTVKDLTKKISEIDWGKAFSQDNINKISNTIKVVGGVTAAVLSLKAALGGVRLILDSINGIMIAGKGIAKLLAWAGGAVSTTGLSLVGLMFGAHKANKYWDKKESEIISAKINNAPLKERKKAYEEMIKSLELQVGILKKADENEDRYSRKTLKTMEKLKNLKLEYARFTGNTQGYYTFGNSSKSDIEKWNRLESKLDSYKKKVFKTKEEINKAMEELVKSGAKDYQLQYFKNLEKDFEQSISSSPVISNTISTVGKKGEEAIARQKNEIAELLKEYQDFSTKSPKIWELLGLDEKEILEEKIFFLKSALQKSVEIGATALIPSLKTEFDKANKELVLKISKINFEEGKKNLIKELDALNKEDITKIGAYNSKNLKETEYEKNIAKYRVLDKFINSIDENTANLNAVELEDIKSRKENLAKKIILYNKEDKVIKERIENIKSVNNGLSSLASGIYSISSVTGSKTLGSIGGVIDNVASLGSSIGTLTGTGIGSLSAIGSATTSIGAAGAGLAAAGAIATGVGAAIGIGIMAGSIINSRGKKKAAKIDQRNKENESIYAEQVKAMQQLTQVLIKNSEIIKNFTDRMLSDISKNPTLKIISGGATNYDSIYQSMLNGKHFEDISAIEKGSASYRKMFRKKHKDTYTAVKISEDKLLKMLGFDKTELDVFTDAEMRQLDKALKGVSHSDLVNATGRNLTQSNIEEWKKQIHEFVTQLDILEREKKELFKGSTLESFMGIDYISEKKLIEEYTEQFKQLGLVGEQYNETIKEMAKNNQVLVSAMQDVRTQTIENFTKGNGGFVIAMKSYFEKIFKNASSIVYDVAFSDLDSYFTGMFQKISEKLVNIKKSGKLNFKDLLTDIDFSKLKLAETIEIQAKKSLDRLKEFLLNNGIDISIINKILPYSDFTDRLNDLKNALSNAMNEAQKEKRLDTFTKSLGESLYESTKNSLIKAFSESSVYQGLISKFINTEDIKAEIEKVGTFEGAFNIIKNKLQEFGYRLESNNLGGFDAINNKASVENKLGNAYYQDKASNVEIKVINNFNSEVYGVDDLQNRILKSVNIGIETWIKRPKVAP